MRLEIENKLLLDNKKVLVFILDFILAFLIISLLNLLIVNVFKLSPRGLLEEGIETNLYEAKMNVYDWISAGYVSLIVIYLLYLRRFFSLGEFLLKLKK